MQIPLYGEWVIYPLLYRFVWRRLGVCVFVRRLWSAYFLFLGEKTLNRLLAIILFPFIWITAYLYRILWVDLITTIISIFKNLFVNWGLSLLLAVILPFKLIIEMPMAFIVTCSRSIVICEKIFFRETTSKEIMRDIFYKADII